MSSVSLLHVHKWAPLVKHSKGIFVFLRGVTIPVHVFIVLLEMVHLRVIWGMRVLFSFFLVQWCTLTLFPLYFILFFSSVVFNLRG